MHEQLDPVTARQLLAAVARRQRDQRVPSLIAAVTDGEHVLWVGGRGRVNDPDATEPGRPTSTTQYRIGSITKTFTAVLVLQLRDEGRLRLTDPVGTLVPGVGDAVADRRVDELLAHTGGLAAETSPPWWERTAGRSWEDLAADLGHESERPAARGRFHYSNLGYALLGEVVARLRGAPWAQVLAERILQPLELRRTGVSATHRATAGRAVHPWSGATLPEPAHDAGAMAPAGQLWSTATDLARWARFLLGDTGHVLAVDTLAEMTEPRVVVDLTTGSGHGLGVSVQTADSGAGARLLVGHAGSMPGFGADVRVDRDAGLGAVVLADSTLGPGRGLITDLLDVVASRRPPVDEEWFPRAPDAAQAELAGVWFWGPRPHVVTAAGGGALEIAPLDDAGRHTRLEPETKGVWRGRGGYFDGEAAHVVRDADGVAVSLEIASFAFTRRPYGPPEVVPGGVQDGDAPGW